MKLLNFLFEIPIKIIACLMIQMMHKIVIIVKNRALLNKIYYLLLLKEKIIFHLANNLKQLKAIQKIATMKKIH